MNHTLPTSREIIEKQGLSLQVGQLFMPAAFINDTEAAICRMEALIRDYHIGGLCFFHSPASAATNFEGAREIPHNPDSLGTLKALIRRYQEAARYPLLIAMDAEWGLAMRIENGEAYPYALTLGALEPGHPLVYQTGLRMAADCREAGVHWNLAPVADVNLNPANPVIGYRAFGSDPQAVSKHALAFYLGLRDGGVLGCAKHFPGHGDTAVDSHLELPVLDKPRTAMEKAELLPFRSLIDNGVDAVMTGHLAVPSLDPEGLPASLSRRMIQGLLRETMGFQGPVITDALNMRAVQIKYPAKGELAFRALLAGNDLLCFAEEIPDAISRISKEAPKAVIQAAFSRVWALKEKVFSATTDARATPEAKARQPKWPEYGPHDLRKALAAACLTLFNDHGGAGRQQPSGDARLPESFGLLLAGTGLETFREGISGAFDCDCSTWDLHPDAKDRLSLPGRPDLLLALSPPALKPRDQFGISDQALKALRTLLAERNVYLCHFGNPYALQLLPIQKAEQVLIAYQSLEEFQQQAVRYYTGKADAPGTLPVSLNLPDL